MVWCAVAVQRPDAGWLAGWLDAWLLGDIDDHLVQNGRTIVVDNCADNSIYGTFDEGHFHRMLFVLDGQYGTTLCCCNHTDVL